MVFQERVSESVDVQKCVFSCIIRLITADFFSNRQPLVNKFHVSKSFACMTDIRDLLGVLTVNFDIVGVAFVISEASQDIVFALIAHILKEIGTAERKLRCPLLSKSTSQGPESLLMTQKEPKVWVLTIREP